jgi:aminopeptidase N
MLRGVVGTENFWAGIREYYQRYRNSNASTPDLRRVMEQASGQDLGWFFDQWLHRPTSPSFDGAWRYDATTRQVEVVITQTQTGEPYRMPIEIGIVMDGRPFDAAQGRPIDVAQGRSIDVAQGRPQLALRVERREMTAKESRFTIAAEREPAAVTFDPNTWLLTDQATFVKRP